MAIGIAPCLPGFMAQLGGPNVSEGWKQIYAVSWFVAFGVSFVVYAAACRVFPLPMTLLCADAQLDGDPERPEEGEGGATIRRIRSSDTA
jgi:cytosine/uracil/thiamine/allantoin permease